MRSSLIWAVVPKGKGDALYARAREAGSPGGTVFYARGTAPAALLSVLGFEDPKKEAVLVLCPQDAAGRVFDAMALAPRSEGIVFSSGCAPAGGKATKEEMMENETAWHLVSAIVNRGLADEVMRAARKAGAQGGTVLSGRGTGTAEDAGFFGVRIVPEKELLMILVDSARLDAVFDAIAGLPLLQSKGSGIVFCLPVSRFRRIGG